MRHHLLRVDYEALVAGVGLLEMAVDDARLELEQSRVALVGDMEHVTTLSELDERLEQISLLEQRLDRIRVERDKWRRMKDQTPVPSRWTRDTRRPGWRTAR